MLNPIPEIIEIKLDLSKLISSFSLNGKTKNNLELKNISIAKSNFQVSLTNLNMARQNFRFELFRFSANF